MDEIKELSEKEIDSISGEKGFQRNLIVKDYYITVLLYILKDIKGIIFKGGTALQKTVLDYARISEDIDLTLQKDLDLIKQEIIQTINETKLFGKIGKDKDVTMFTRLIVPYYTKLGKSEIFIDLNEKAGLLTQPERFDMKHFYPNIPKFDFLCLSQNEMIGEKVAAAIARNKPRDHFDIYQIIKHKLKIDLKIVKAKCEKSGNDPSILKMFNKAKRLHRRWNDDMLPLMSKDITFQEVMKTLAEHFNLKEEKEKMVDANNGIVRIIKNKKI